MALNPSDTVATPAAERDQSFGTQAGELKDLVVVYAKQETIEPLKGLLRFVGFGVAGAVLLAGGVVFLCVGAVRALQFELHAHLAGNLSWVPYLGGVVLAAAVAVLAVTRIGKVSSGKVSSGKVASGQVSNNRVSP